MIRTQHVEMAIQQCRHRVLCNILTEVEEGQNLIERARRLGFPVDWQDVRTYPNRPGYSDYGATFMLAKDVARAETARHFKMTGQSPDYLALDAMSSRQAQHEATSIFNSLRARGIELSGYAQGRYFTSQPMPWSRPRSPAPAPAPVPPRSRRH